eukprot:jgi/Mesvir1/23541/Mv18242-RA.1
MDRVGWMDNRKNMMIQEIIRKEDAVRNDFLDAMAAEKALKDEDLGLTPPRTPSSPAPRTQATMTTTLRKPPANEEERLAEEMSKNLWSSMGTGFASPSRRMQSTAKAQFTYDEEEVELPDKKNFRKRDDFSNYVEAAARHKMVMKKAPDA